MKRLMTRLLRASLFALVFMPIHVIIGRSLTAGAWLSPAWFAAQTLVAALITLIPAYVGNVREYEVVKYVGVERYDPNPDRQTEHTRVREGHRFPIRLVVAILLLAGCALCMVFLPVELFADAHITPKIVFIVMLLGFFALSMRDIAMAECVWADVPGICFGAVLYLIAALYLRFSGGVSALINAQIGVSAVLFLFIGAITLNKQSVAMSMAVSSGVARKPPKQVRRRNRVMSITFALVVAVIGLVEPIRDGILWLIARIGDAFNALSRWFYSLFPKGESMPPAEDMYSYAPQAEQAAQVAEEVYETSTFTYIIVYVFFGFVAVSLVWLIIDRIIKLCKKLSAWIEKFASGIGEGFYDEREKLVAEDMSEHERGQSWLDRLRARLKREPDWDTLSGRLRMRRLLRNLYKRRGGGIANLRALTAREAIARMDIGRANPEELGEAYDRARYSDLNVENAEADKLKKDSGV